MNLRRTPEELKQILIEEHERNSKKLFRLSDILAMGIYDTVYEEQRARKLEFGPKYVKKGRFIFYPIKNLINYLEDKEKIDIHTDAPNDEDKTISMGYEELKTLIRQMILEGHRELYFRIRTSLNNILNDMYDDINSSDTQ